MEIITNNHPRELITVADLTEAERADFDYISEEEHFSPRLVRYRGEVYDTAEFVRIVPRSRAVGFEHGVDADSPLLRWDGIQTDSYFSAVLLRWVPGSHYEEVVVGRAYS